MDFVFINFASPLDSVPQVIKMTIINIKKSLRYQRDNQNQYIEEEHNGQKHKDKMTNNDLQNMHIKLKIE